jgi:hypothetical protein
VRPKNGKPIWEEKRGKKDRYLVEIVDEIVSCLGRLSTGQPSGSVQTPHSAAPFMNAPTAMASARVSPDSNIRIPPGLKIEDPLICQLEENLRMNNQFWSNDNLYMPPEENASYTTSYFTQQAVKVKGLASITDRLYSEVQQTNLQSLEFFDRADALLTQIKKKSGELKGLIPVESDHSLGLSLEKAMDGTCQAIETTGLRI